MFREAAAATEPLAQFQRTAHDEKFELLAYCVVPDHVHLLVEGLNKDSDLRRFVKMCKQRTGFAYRTRCGDRLWQEGYFERVLRDDADAREYAKYIINNPVRAGLVAKAADYEFLGATAWSLDELTKDALNDIVSPAP